MSIEMSRKVMAAILDQREVAPLLSDDHFSVGGALIKAWASMKSFRSKAEEGTPPDDEGTGAPPVRDATPDDQPSKPETAPIPRPKSSHRNAEVDFRGEKRSNATHTSTTDPGAWPYKKSPGAGAMLCCIP